VLLQVLQCSLSPPQIIESGLQLRRLSKLRLLNAQRGKFLLIEFENAGLLGSGLLHLEQAAGFPCWRNQLDIGLRRFGLWGLFAILIILQLFYLLLGLSKLVCESRN
jgi:hypothetical protein